MNETHAPWPGNESSATAVVDAQKKKQQQMQRIDNFWSISSGHTRLCNAMIIHRPYTEPWSVSGTYQLTVECNIVVAIDCAFFRRWSNEQFLCVHLCLETKKREKKTQTQATYVYVFCTNRNGALLSTFFFSFSISRYGNDRNVQRRESVRCVSLLIIVFDFVFAIAKHWTWLLFLCQVGALCKHDNYDTQRSNQRCFCYYLTFLHLPLLLFLSTNDSPNSPTNTHMKK